MKQSSINSKRSERLMHSLYEAQQDLDELARRERLTLTWLAGWATQPDTIAALDGLCRLNDVRAQLLVSRYRTLAAARLFELAKDEGAGELARKACVDLLKVCLIPLTGGEVAAERAGAVPSVIDEGAVRRLLGELGREAGAPPEAADGGEAEAADASPCGAD